jgi:hypothetical protein
MNPVHQYHQRFLDLRAQAALPVPELLQHNPALLNNLIMAGLGMGTLFLRMGAVVQLCRRLHDGAPTNDVLFLKQVVDNLRETLPSDTNWKNVWYAAMEPGSAWQAATPADKGNSTLLDRFVTFRNRMVHQQVRLHPDHTAELTAGLDILDQMAGLHTLFLEGELEVVGGLYHWRQQGHSLPLHPFVQPGGADGLPYLFQGLHANKTLARFIGPMHGDETEPGPNPALDEGFRPMQEALRGGAGEVFDHTERMRYYLECFVGREREVQAAVQWALGDGSSPVLPIHAQAGMGKGALSAGIISALQQAGVPTLYHFCGSGMANSLHAVLYHFILQGGRMPGMNGASIWKVQEERIQRRMQRLPSRYTDAIRLFQDLLTHCYAPPRKFQDKPLVVLIDGLDEAAVANGQLRIVDWFMTYNDKDEPEQEWTPPPFLRWIFTYRSLPAGRMGGFELGGTFALATEPLLQPLRGLDGAAVREALQEFHVSEEFVETVIHKGAVA